MLGRLCACVYGNGTNEKKERNREKYAVSHTIEDGKMLHKFHVYAPKLITCKLIIYIACHYKLLTFVVCRVCSGGIAFDDMAAADRSEKLKLKSQLFCQRNIY